MAPPRHACLRRSVRRPSPPGRARCRPFEDLRPRIEDGVSHAVLLKIPRRIWKYNPRSLAYLRFYAFRFGRRILGG